MTSELEDLFEKNDIVGACDKLKSLQKSLVAQMGLSGQQEREAQVDGFKNRLEALASPAVVQCFVSGDIGNINATHLTSSFKRNYPNFTFHLQSNVRNTFRFSPT